MLKRFVCLIAICFFAVGMVWCQEPMIRVPESEAKKAATSSPNPEYPPMAKQMRLSGRVQVDAYIDPTGTVEKVQVISGNPLLTSAASAALKKWKFTPFTANGKPTKAVANFSFEFKQ